MIDGERYIRISGNQVCESCGTEQWRHQREIGYTEMGEEVSFVRMCNGKLGKT